MKRIMNDAARYCREAAEGFLFAHTDTLSMVAEDPFLAVRSTGPDPAEVPVMAVGDGGHFPMFHGYVGPGMLSGSVLGEVFQAPDSRKILTMLRTLDRGHGVVLLYDSAFCTGKTLQAVDEARKMGIQVFLFTLQDDYGAAFGWDKTGTRCGAGLLLCCKLAGAAASAGKTGEEILELLYHAREHMATVGMIAEDGFHPRTEKKFLPLTRDTVQIGGGLHNEPGFEQIPVPPADIAAEHMFRKKLNPIVTLSAGDHAAVLLNGYGGMALEELFILYRKLSSEMHALGIFAESPLVGNYGGNLGANGYSITLLKLDAPLLPLWNAPVNTAALRRG